MRKDDEDEKEKNENLLREYKVLEDEYDLLKIEHRNNKIVEHCKFLEQKNGVEIGKKYGSAAES